MHRPGNLLLSVVLAGTASSCSGPGVSDKHSGSEALSSAEHAVEVFRRQMAQRDFDRIYADSIKHTWIYGSRENVVAMLEAAAASLGDFSCGVINAPAVRRNKDGSSIVAFNCLSAFERSGGAEVFYFRVENGEARLLDYRVQPDGLGLIAPRSIWLSNLSPVTLQGERANWNLVELPHD